MTAGESTCCLKNVFLKVIFVYQDLVSELQCDSLNPSFSFQQLSIMLFFLIHRYVHFSFSLSADLWTICSAVSVSSHPTCAVAYPYPFSPPDYFTFRNVLFLFLVSCCLCCICSGMTPAQQTPIKKGGKYFVCERGRMRARERECNPDPSSMKAFISFWSTATLLTHLSVFLCGCVSIKIRNFISILW